MTDPKKSASLEERQPAARSPQPALIVGPNWANQTIWTGDNLPIMRGMNSESVDLIYLDPPFNSKANYAAPIGSRAAGAEFKDTWTLQDVDIAWLDLLEAKHLRLWRVIQAAMTKSDKSYLIYMSVRLLEMHRLLKPAGSIYLHCDPTMSHWLKLVMDAIFGRGNFRNEIIWKRSVPHNDSKGFGRVADTILFYGSGINSDAVREPLDSAYVTKFYRHIDSRGKYRAGPLTTKGLSGGGYYYDFFGHPGPWRYPEKRMKELEADGRIHFPKKIDGVPSSKLYLHENKGQVPSSIWTDIPPVQGSSKQRTGYPTQKPLALLERIIRASSKEGDIVLDPFCGCATTCVAAEELSRQWVGIDIGPKAYDLVKDRLDREIGYSTYTCPHREDIPQRTDIKPLKKYNHPDNKKYLYGEQGGHCNGCGEHFQMQNLTVDHIIDRNSGGTDHLENLQLLCGYCNSVKGNRGQEYLIAKLAA